MSLQKPLACLMHASLFSWQLGAVSYGNAYIIAVIASVRRCNNVYYLLEYAYEQNIQDNI